MKGPGFSHRPRRRWSDYQCSKCREFHHPTRNSVRASATDRGARIGGRYGRKPLRSVPAGCAAPTTAPPALRPRALPSPRRRRPPATVNGPRRPRGATLTSDPDTPLGPRDTRNRAPALPNSSRRNNARRSRHARQAGVRTYRWSPRPLEAHGPGGRRGRCRRWRTHGYSRGSSQDLAVSGLFVVRGEGVRVQTDPSASDPASLSWIERGRGPTGGNRGLHARQRPTGHRPQLSNTVRSRGGCGCCAAIRRVRALGCRCPSAVARRAVRRCWCRRPLAGRGRTGGGCGCGRRRAAGRRPRPR